MKTFSKFIGLGGLITGLAIASATTAIAQDGLMGVNVLTYNTFSGAPTNNMETDVGMFGMNNNLFVTIGDAVELPKFIALYDIDFGENSISFSWVETGFSATASGTTTADTHDRNYFVFDLPADMMILSVEFDAAGSTLLDGSALPMIDIVSRNKIVTNFSEGIIRDMGFAPRFIIEVGLAPAQ